MVKSFPACNFAVSPYKIEKRYIIFSQDVSNCFELVFNCKVT